MQKEIEYYEVLKDCWGIKGLPWIKGDKVYTTNKDSFVYFNEIGLINNLNYFKPVYREDKKLPKINTYEGKLEGDYVIYGSNCAKFHKQFFKDLQQLVIHNHNSAQNRTIKSIKLDSGVEITMDEVKQIVNYIN